MAFPIRGTNADMTSLVTPSGQTVTYGYTNHRITIWIPAIAFGSTPIREIGFVGFAISLIFWWTMLSIYNKGKATGRNSNLSPRSWKHQVW
jgi:hypothetical protein